MAERGAGQPRWELSPYQVTVSYPRTGMAQGAGADWFGPLQPMTPTAPPAVAGRAWDYPSGWNLNTRPKANEPITFADLRGLADGYDLMRLVIETRKDQVERMDWSIKPREKSKKTAAADPRIKAIKDFLRKPDGEHNWATWLRMVLEDLFVIDAPSLYVERNRGGKMLALHPLDGATIKRVVDDWGRTPRTIVQDGVKIYPAAYQQVLKGLPAVNYSVRDLIYKPRNLRVHKAYGFSPVEQVIVTVNIALRRQVFQLQYYCYSDDTEVLTKRGWMRFAETSPSDEFATRQINTGVFEWQKAYDTFYKHYTGKMIHFTGKSLDMMVTPHHRMLVDALPRALHQARHFKASEHVITAEQLAAAGTRNTGIPLTSKWEGVEIGSRVFADADVRSKAVEMNGDDYCAFMGMYLAEGNLHHKGSIAISQPPDDRGAHVLFGDLLRKIFGTGVCYSGHQFEVCRKALASYLRQFGKAHEKFIPDDIREATPRQLAIFMRYYLLGDGRAAGDSGVQTQQAYTVSRRLADHLTEVGQKLGFAPSVWTRKAGAARLGNRTLNAKEGFLVSFAKMDRTCGWRAEEVDYDAPVACVCVPNKFLYVRRNGKAAWSGNTEGNIPEALIGVPESWNPDQIKAFQDYWDATFSGNTAQRRHAKFVPGGIAKTFIQTKEAELKNIFDEWLARVVCFAFSISNQPFVTQVNRATSDTQKEMAEEEGLAPILSWVKNLIDDIMADEFDAPDLELAWGEDTQIDPLQESTILKTYVGSGILTINQALDRLGEDPDPDPMANTRLVLTATGYVPLDSFQIQQKQAEDAAKAMADATKATPADKVHPSGNEDALAGAEA